MPMWYTDGGSEWAEEGSRSRCYWRNKIFFYDKKFMIKSPLGLRKKSIKGVSERHETQVPKTC